jgi:hypothetical protein
MNFDFDLLKQSPLRNSMSFFIKKRDLFGVKVGLTYQGYPVHRTVCSGVLSIVLLTYMLWFSG